MHNQHNICKKEPKTDLTDLIDLTDLTDLIDLIDQLEDLEEPYKFEQSKKIEELKQMNWNELRMICN